MNSVEDLKQYKISCQWVDSWKGILENTSKSTNSKPFKYIKWAKQSINQKGLIELIKTNKIPIKIRKN